MQNKRLNFWYVIVATTFLIVITIGDNYFDVQIRNYIYYILISTIIAALGNYIVIKYQQKRTL